MCFYVLSNAIGLHKIVKLGIHFQLIDFQNYFVKGNILQNLSGMIHDSKILSGKICSLSCSNAGEGNREKIQSF